MTTNEDVVALNFSRAQDAEKALLAYIRVKECKAVKSIEASSDVAESWLTDLLTDLRHWTNQRGMDFAESVRLSEMHFECEVDDERDERDDEPVGGGQ